MSVTGTILHGACRLARLKVELSQKARQRLNWFDYYYSDGHNACITRVCSDFGGKLLSLVNGASVSGAGCIILAPSICPKTTEALQAYHHPARKVASPANHN